MTEKQKVLIIGNKEYRNFNFNRVVDSYDTIYRFNFAWPGKNNGTKFGKLAMCSHMYENYVTACVSKEKSVDKYIHEIEREFLCDWYDFFEDNKQNFDEIYYERVDTKLCNKMLEDYKSPHRFRKMASSGYSVIFKNLAVGNEVHVMGFTLCAEETRKTLGENETVVTLKNGGGGSHSFSDERDILAWLHNNKKIDATLCMVEDTEKLSFRTNQYSTEPSEAMLELLKAVE